MKKAFTLMEVLIVISIISVLIGIAVPRIKGFQEQAKKQKAQSSLKVLQTAVEAYYMRHSEYPPQTDTLSADYLMSEASPKIDEVLYDPFGDGTQEYNYLVDGDYWAVSSRGSDRVRNVPVFSSNRLLIAAGVDDLAQTNGVVATCAEGGYTDCGGSCNDLQTDADNCGTCGAAGGPDCCAGLPVDLTDEANCGTCGNVCGADYVCENGACIDPCLAAAAGPGTECVDGTIYVSATLRTTPSDAGTMLWSTELIVTGATNTSDGAENTTHLMTHSTGTNYPAAEYCANLGEEGGGEGHGYQDWYLPAKDELDVLYVNRAALGGNQINVYWSSTDYNSRRAWVQFFNGGWPYFDTYKNEDFFYVRCVRTP